MYLYIHGVLKKKKLKRCAVSFYVVAGKLYGTSANLLWGCLVSHQKLEKNSIAFHNLVLQKNLFLWATPWILGMLGKPHRTVYQVHLYHKFSVSRKPNNMTSLLKSACNRSICSDKKLDHFVLWNLILLGKLSSKFWEKLVRYIW